MLDLKDLKDMIAINDQTDSDEDVIVDQVTMAELLRDAEYLNLLKWFAQNTTPCAKCFVSAECAGLDGTCYCGTLHEIFGKGQELYDNYCKQNPVEVVA
jgi:hypothetical protein